jgi:hypothetical protein
VVVRAVFAPKGRNNIAQGIALGTGKEQYPFLDSPRRGTTIYTESP